MSEKLTDEEVQRTVNLLSEAMAEPQDEDLLYWSTPYWDYLQEQKRIKEEAIKNEVHEK